MTFSSHTLSQGITGDKIRNYTCQTTDNWKQRLWTDEVQRTENSDWENDVSTCVGLVCWFGLAGVFGRCVRFGLVWPVCLVWRVFGLVGVLVGVLDLTSSEHTMGCSNTRNRGKKRWSRACRPYAQKDAGPASGPVGPHGRGQTNPPSAPWLREDSSDNNTSKDITSTNKVTS